MKRVALVAITEGDLCIAHFCQSLAQSLAAGLEQKVEFLTLFTSAYGNWSMEFNQALTLAWKEKIDGVVFIHPFVSWDPQGLLALCHSNKDAIGLPVATRNGFELDLGELSRLQKDEETGELKVKSTSLDFFYLSANAIEALCTAHPSVSYHGRDVRLVLQSGDIYETYHEPSTILLYRLKEQGIETWLNPRYTAYRQDPVTNTASFDRVLQSLLEND